MNITLRLVKEDELELIMAWRSNPLIFKGFYSQTKPLTWYEHFTWHMNRNKDWRNFMVWLNPEDLESGPRRIGVVTVGNLDHWCPEIGYYIGETTLWGQGYGKIAVREGLRFIQRYGRNAARTTILDDNGASMHLIESFNFRQGPVSRPGEHWWFNGDLFSSLG